MGVGNPWIFAVDPDYGCTISTIRICKACLNSVSCKVLEQKLPQLEKYIKNEKTKTIDPKDLGGFFASENKKNHRYWIPEKRKASVWTFTPENYGITISDQDIESYYNSHKSKEFVNTPLQMKVRRILFAVPEGANVQEIQAKAQQVKTELAQEPSRFEELAMKYNPSSDSNGIIKKGGIVDFFSKGEKDPAFERAAFRLQKDGDISDIITTSEGFEIVSCPIGSTFSAWPIFVSRFYG